MSDRGAGWLVVIVSALLGAVVTLVTAGLLRSEFVSPDAHSADTWLDGALAALQTSILGILMVMVLDVVAFVIGKNLWVRVAAVIVAVATILGVMAAGGAVAVTTEPFVAEPVGPGTFDCTEPEMQTAQGMQEAVDELVHPGQVDTIGMGVDSCGGIVRLVLLVEALPDYQSQLESAGWTIDAVDEVSLTAQRGEFTFTVFPCGEETAIEIRVTTTPATIWC